MLHLGELVPAEEEQADKRRLQKEGHQAFDRQRRAENVADIMAVITPVHAELEFHGDAGGDPQDEVDPEQRSPELGHLAPDRAVCHHIDRFHDGHHDRQTERQRHEKEMVHGSHRELQARQLYNAEFH